MTSVRSWSVFRPGNGILFPGTAFCGSARYEFRVFSSQTMFACFIAGE